MPRMMEAILKMSVRRKSMAMRRAVQMERRRTVWALVLL